MMTTVAPRAWRWPEVRPRPALVLLAGSTVFGVWQGLTFLFALRADGNQTPWMEPLLWELSGALAGWAAFWIPATATLNAPRPRPLVRFVAIHLAGIVAFAVLKDSLMLGARFLAYPVLGWGSYRYAFTPAHLAMELMKDALAYGLFAVVYGLFRAWRDRQALALREARLATELKEARLLALLGQLNPHFLFNALNTISSVMYTDLERTDRMLSDLGLLLRAGFESDRATWSLADERAHTDRFFALLQARFGDRVRLRWEIEPGAERVPVPRFALQLLVENAIKHNQDRPDDLEIRLRAHRHGGTLVLEVEDTGRGFAASSPAGGAGLGLRHLEQALTLLHGTGAQLERENRDGGGARVRVTVPVEP
jgi:signal transduction histidine kinase